MMPPIFRCPSRRQSGLSLIELMVAITLGLIVMAALLAIFAASSRTRQEMQKTTQQRESGRYASQLLSDNLSLAGYLAEFNPNLLTSPAAVPDPCATSIPDLLDALPLHVQGGDDASSIPSCLSDVKTGTDILVVRRASSCVAGGAGCDPFVEGRPHFQASLCMPTDGSNTELARIASSNAEYAAFHFSLSNVAADFVRRSTNCTAPAAIRRYLVRIFFIANNNEPGDGIPTLKSAELGADGFTIVPLVDGIENMQIEYGVDSVGSDGIPDIYTSDPGSVAGWRNVMTARVHLLSRNTQMTLGHADTRIYTLGRDSGGDDKIVGPFSDEYKRHVYSTTTQFVNPSWRRQ